jgi:hypothetical protein
MILGQMQERPNNNDLQEYYQRKNSKSKDKKKINARPDKSTEKIYLQRLDSRKK